MHANDRHQERARLDDLDLSDGRSAKEGFFPSGPPFFSVHFRAVKKGSETIHPRHDMRCRQPSPASFAVLIPVRACVRARTRVV
jgi:hypothetical protein